MKNFYRTVDLDAYKKRLLLLLLVITAVFAILLARLIFLQIIEGADYLRLSANNCIRLQDIDPLRGLIFDRSGKCLVENRPSFDLNIIPNDAGNVDDTLYTLAEITGFSHQDWHGYRCMRSLPGQRPVMPAVPQ